MSEIKRYAVSERSRGGEYWMELMENQIGNLVLYSDYEKLKEENAVHKESRINLENWNDILVDKNAKLESELAESKRQVQEQKNEIVEIRREWDRLYSLYLLEVAKNEKSEAVLSKHKTKGK